MSQPGTEEILEVCGKVGEILLNAGAETSRIETTVEYIGALRQLVLKNKFII